MKLYVLPTETNCTADCNFCITKYRDHSSYQYLSYVSLSTVLDSLKPNKIEITGGGEPLLNPDIDRIVSCCTHWGRKAKLYTNGSLFEKVVRGNNSHLGWLSEIVVSRAHYDDSENQRIMGISYDSKYIFDFGWNVGLSLLAHKSGISDFKELKKYLSWARGMNAKKVVVRQLFDHDYCGNLKDEFVSTKNLAENFDYFEKGNSLHTLFVGMPVEFELRSCECEKDNLVLHADGKVYKGWTKEVLHDFNRTGNKKRSY